ncbi:MAG: tetratricopeptide repeat protein [Saprospiraceae bacterium]
MDTGKYELALSMLDAWEQQTSPSEYVWIWIQKGDMLKTLGKSEDALAIYKKVQALAEQNGDKTIWHCVTKGLETSISN